jgi:hypothetical protein
MRRRPRRQGWDCGSERLAKDHNELAEVRALAELFPTRVRYGGFSVPHNVADAIMEDRGRAHSRRRTDTKSGWIALLFHAASGHQ